MVNKIKNIIALGIILTSFFVTFQSVLVSNYSSNYAFAEELVEDGNGNITTPNGNNGRGGEAPAEAKTAILPSDWKIEDILNMVLVVVTTGVGIAAVGSIVFAGVLYITARDNAAQVSKAKTMITNTIIGIIAYILMWAFLEWIIPGGIL